MPGDFTTSKKVEVYLTHPVAGIIQLIEDESMKVIYNNRQDLST